MALLDLKGNTLAKVFIGTSNVVLPGAKHTFPSEFQAMSRLAYYSTVLNTVEINSSFYKTPQYKTLDRWVGETQPNFRFTLKMSRAITHQKALFHTPSDIDNFCNVMSAVGSKKGCLLIQFPASITEDYFEKVLSILKRIRRNNRDPRWKLCVEFRHDSWYEPHVYKMLSKTQAHLVLHDKRGSRTPSSAPLSSVVYVRFHGPNGDYRGAYDRQFLQQYAIAIQDWISQGKEVYVYFNNTMGTAFADAKLLQSFLGNNG